MANFIPLTQTLGDKVFHRSRISFIDYKRVQGMFLSELLFEKFGIKAKIVAPVFAVPASDKLKLVTVIYNQKYNYKMMELLEAHECQMKMELSSELMQQLEKGYSVLGSESATGIHIQTTGSYLK